LRLSSLFQVGFSVVLVYSTLASNKFCFAFSLTFDSCQRKATQEAAEMAGIRVLGLEVKPVAALLAVLFGDSRNPEGRYMVFDFGGSAFDVSLVDYKKSSSSSLVAFDGVQRLGERDIDRWLYNEIEDLLLKEHGVDMKKKPKQQATKLFEAISTAKTNLGSNPAVTIEWQYDDGTELELAQEMLQKVFKENKVNDQLTEAVERLLKNVRIKKEDLSGVLLKGGSSLSCVKELVRNMFNPSRVVRYFSLVCSVCFVTHLSLFSRSYGAIVISDCSPQRALPFKLI
jgi:molecular chaperone DnaK (HSP70)